MPIGNLLSVAPLVTKQQSETFQVAPWIDALQAPFLSQFGPCVIPRTLSTRRPDSRRKRELEFEQGRSFASNLLQQFDCCDEVGVNEDRSPAWPSGFAGSISHSKNWMWTVTGRQSQLQSVGIDTEPVVDAKTRQQLSEEIANAIEWSLFRGLALSPEQCFSLAFSAKEAFYKCCYPIVQTYFGFEHGLIESVDATKIRICTPHSHPCFGLMPNSLDVHYLVSAQDVFCVTWMEARQ